MDELPSTVELEDLPESGVPDVRAITVVFTPTDDTKPVVVSDLESECCYKEGKSSQFPSEVARFACLSLA